MPSGGYWMGRAGPGESRRPPGLRGYFVSQAIDFVGNNASRNVECVFRVFRSGFRGHGWAWGHFVSHRVRLLGKSVEICRTRELPVLLEDGEGGFEANERRNFRVSENFLEIFWCRVNDVPRRRILRL